jgi:hypothetical protein
MLRQYNFTNSTKPFYGNYIKVFWSVLNSIDNISFSRAKYILLIGNNISIMVYERARNFSIKTKFSYDVFCFSLQEHLMSKSIRYSALKCSHEILFGRLGTFSFDIMYYPFPLSCTVLWLNPTTASKLFSYIYIMDPLFVFTCVCFSAWII